MGDAVACRYHLMATSRDAADAADMAATPRSAGHMDYHTLAVAADSTSFAAVSAGLRTNVFDVAQVV